MEQQPVAVRDLAPSRPSRRGLMGQGAARIVPALGCAGHAGRAGMGGVSPADTAFPPEACPPWQPPWGQPGYH